MKKRIGTKLYDTDTSEMICEVEGGKLYRKCSRDRSWFLLTNDGMIRPLTEADRDLIRIGEDHIGEVTKPASTTIWVDRDTHSKLAAAAKQMGCSISEVVRKLVRHLVLFLKM